MAEVKDLKTSIDGAIALLDKAFGNAEQKPNLGRKKGSIQYPDDEKAVEWIIGEIRKRNMTRAIHIRNAIERFYLKGASQEAIYDRIRKKVAIRLKN